MISHSKKSSIPFVDPNQLELRPSSDASSSSSQPNHNPATLPRKKKPSILHKLSISSRRSLSWLPGVHDPQHHPQQPQEQQPNTLSASSAASLSSSASSADQNDPHRAHSNSKVQFSSNAIPNVAPRATPQSNSAQSTKADNHSTKTSFGKGIRSVARTVKKSLHQFERPRSIAVDHLDRISGNDHTDSKARNSFQHQNRSHDSQSSNNRNPNPSSPNQRTRAVSASEVHDSNRSRDSRIDQPSQSLDTSSPAQPLEPAHVLPSSSPQRSPKKSRPLSAAQLESVPSTRVSNRHQHDRLSWHSQTPVSSLPMAANMLAAPSPPPVDHSTFLAIIPGQKTPGVIPSLSVIPPAVSQSVEPPALTGASMRVEPALSRRVSLTSSAGGGNSTDENGFTFIRTPSSKPDSAHPSPSVPSSPAPNGLPSLEWADIVGQSTTLESLKSRPPLVSMSTTISLVQSCVAERGSINELEEIREQSLGYHVTESHEESTPTEARNDTNFLASSSEDEYAKAENRKRKNSGESNAEENKANHTVLDSSEGISRQHKVLRSMNQPFSSSKTSTAIGMNHETSHSLSLLTFNQTRTTSTTKTEHLIHQIGTLNRNNSEQKNVKNRKNSTKSNLSSNKNLSTISKNRNNHDGPNHNRNGNEIWNLTVVSTVVGVVIIAAVLIGSTNFSNLNGKSWIGNLVKKI